MKQILLLLILTQLLSGCVSHKVVNKTVSQIRCTKTIHFALDTESKFAKIEYKGEHMGNSPYPNYKSSLRDAVEELDKISTAKLVYQDAIGFPNDTIIQVTVKIEKIIWDFSSPKIKMEADLRYKMPDRTIHLVANNRVFLAGTKKGNVFKTLKHGNSMLLSILCDE